MPATAVANLRVAAKRKAELKNVRGRIIGRVDQLMEVKDQCATDAIAKGSQLRADLHFGLRLGCWGFGFRRRLPFARRTQRRSGGARSSACRGIRVCGRGWRWSLVCFAPACGHPDDAGHRAGHHESSQTKSHREISSRGRVVSCQLSVVSRRFSATSCSVSSSDIRQLPLLLGATQQAPPSPLPSVVTLRDELVV